MTGRLLTLLLLALIVPACSDHDEAGPVRIAVAEDRPELRDPNRTPPGEGAALLFAATSQGLVRLDAEGQVEPGLARRWTVLDDGRTYIFRLGDHEWPDGTAVTAGEIARHVRAAARQGGRNRLAPLLADIENVNAVTPLILEIVLRKPRVDLLQLLAQPDMALLGGEGGVGPFRIASEEDARIELVGYRSSDVDAESEAPSPGFELAYMRPAAAVARFELGQVDMVAGGGWTSLAYAEAIGPSASALRIDPVDGLFGLEFVEFTGFLGEAANRTVLSLAIDRQRLAEMTGRPEAEPRSVILSPNAEGVGPYQLPGWIEADMDRRRAFARSAVRRWEEVHGEIRPLRIALPDAAGSRLFFAAIAAAWRAIGIETERVAIGADADLRLIDRVAATTRGSWYFAQFRCDRALACNEDYRAALGLYEESQAPGIRVLATAKAARALQEMAPFIPLLRPIRWSLVSPRLNGFETNAYAAHPLDQLLAATGD